VPLDDWTAGEFDDRLVTGALMDEATRSSAGHRVMRSGAIEWR
jgi:hypothetical protein